MFLMKARNTGMTVLTCPSFPANAAICLDVRQRLPCKNEETRERVEEAFSAGIERVLVDTSTCMPRNTIFLQGCTVLAALITNPSLEKQRWTTDMMMGA